jgi:hypothetical protein
MPRSLWVAAILAAPGLAPANDALDATLKSRAIASAAAAAEATSPPGSVPAPFVQNREPMPQWLARNEPPRRASASCQHSTQDLCYDLAEARIVYRPVRHYMPKIEGLTAESVSLRHHKLVVRYSFR